VRREDSRGDARAEALFLEASIPLQRDEAITGVTILAPVRIRLHDRARLRTDGMLTLAATSGIAAAGLYADGELILRQREPLRVADGFLDPTGGNDLVDFARVYAQSDVAPAEVLKRYHDRNYTVQFQPDVAWVPETGLGPRAAAADGLAATGAIAAASDGGFPALRRPRAFSVRVYARVSP